MQKSAILLGLLLSLYYSMSAESHKFVVEQSINTEGMSPAQAVYHKACFDIALVIVNRFVQGEEITAIVASLSSDIKLYDIDLICQYALQLMEVYYVQLRALRLSGQLSEKEKDEHLQFLQERYIKIIKTFESSENLLPKGPQSVPTRYLLKALDNGKYLVQLAGDNKVETVECVAGSVLWAAALYQVIMQHYIRATVLGAAGLGLFGYAGRDYFVNTPFNFNK